MKHDSLRSLVRGLQAMGAVTLRGEEYTGGYLSLMVGMNPELPVEEAHRTSQLISEMGRLAAAAKYEQEIAELRYRVWKDKIIHQMTNDIEAAAEAGFESAAVPGKYANGKDKPPACPARTVVESYIRTLDEYVEFKTAIAKAEETWSTLYTAFEAAKARQWAIRVTEQSGGAATAGSSGGYQPPVASPLSDDDPNAGYFAPHESNMDHPNAPNVRVEDLERVSDTVERTPLPPPPPNTGPPGLKPKKKTPPPPPPPRGDDNE